MLDATGSLVATSWHTDFLSPALPKCQGSLMVWQLYLQNRASDDYMNLYGACCLLGTYESTLYTMWYLDAGHYIVGTLFM